MNDSEQFDAKFREVLREGKRGSGGECMKTSGTKSEAAGSKEERMENKSHSRNEGPKSGAGEEYNRSMEPCRDAGSVRGKKSAMPKASRRPTTPADTFFMKDGDEIELIYMGVPSDSDDDVNEDN